MIYKFIQQIKNGYIKLSKEEENLMIYALAKGFESDKTRYVCAVDNKDVFHFLDINEKDIEVLQEKTTDIIRKFFVKIKEDNGETSLNLIERCLYFREEKGLLITFNLGYIEKWVKHQEAEHKRATQALFEK